MFNNSFIYNIWRLLFNIYLLYIHWHSIFTSICHTPFCERQNYLFHLPPNFTQDLKFCYLCDNNVLMACKNIVNPELKQRLHVHFPTAPKHYDLMKIRKLEKSLLLIVSALDVPSNKITKWLIKQFENLPGPQEMFVENNSLVSITIETTPILISCDDVKALFSSA